MSDTPDTDVSAFIHHAEETPYDEWVYAGHAKLIARERDTMKAERNEFMMALNRVKKDLAAANKGAETNAKVNQSLCARLEEAQRDRDEARKERDEALDKIELLTYSFRFVCSRYCFNKNASQLALEAYTMFRMERQTIQELDKKEEA